MVLPHPVLLEIMSINDNHSRNKSLIASIIIKDPAKENAEENKFITDTQKFVKHSYLNNPPSIKILIRKGFI